MGFDKPVKSNCLNKFVGPTPFDSSFKNLVFEESERRNETEMAPLIKSWVATSLTQEIFANSSQSLQNSKGLPLKGSPLASVS